MRCPSSEPSEELLQFQALDETARSSTWTSGRVRGRRRVRQAVFRASNMMMSSRQSSWPDWSSRAHRQTIRRDTSAACCPGTPVVDADSIRHDVAVRQSGRRFGPRERQQQEWDHCSRHGPSFTRARRRRTIPCAGSHHTPSGAQEPPSGQYGPARNTRRPALGSERLRVARRQPGSNDSRGPASRLTPHHRRDLHRRSTTSAVRAASPGTGSRSLMSLPSAHARRQPPDPRASRRLSAIAMNTIGGTPL